MTKRVRGAHGTLLSSLLIVCIGLCALPCKLAVAAPTATDGPAASTPGLARPDGLRLGYSLVGVLRADALRNNYSLGLGDRFFVGYEFQGEDVSITPLVDLDWIDFNQHLMTSDSGTFATSGQLLQVGAGVRVAGTGRVVVPHATLIASFSHFFLDVEKMDDSGFYTPSGEGGTYPGFGLLGGAGVDFFISRHVGFGPVVNYRGIFQPALNSFADIGIEAIGAF
jgi:hypothetical protein